MLSDSTLDPIEIKSISTSRLNITLNEPLKLQPYFDGDFVYICVTNDVYGIDDYSESYDDLVESLPYHIAFIWESCVNKDDADLDFDGRQIKQAWLTLTS